MRLSTNLPSLFVLACAAGFAARSTLQAQSAPKPSVTRASELPTFSYPMSGNMEALVRSGASPQVLALGTLVRRDIDSVLKSYNIADPGLIRSLKGTLTQIAMLDDRNDDALKLIAERSALAAKVGSRLLTGINPRAMIAARRGNPDVTSAAYSREVSRQLIGMLQEIPFDSVQNDLREAKSGFAFLVDAFVIGPIRSEAQPLVDKQGAVTLSVARELIATAYTLRFELPIKPTLAAAYDTVLAGRTIASKSDIWKDRSVVFSANEKLTPVIVGIWDSGLDTALFSRQLLRDARGRPVMMGFNRFIQPQNTPMATISPALLARQSEMNRIFKGMGDLDANIDTPDARFVRESIAALPADSVAIYTEWQAQWNGYTHGISVSSVAVDGNPAARIVLGRMEFSYTAIPDPCPSRTNAAREAVMLAQLVKHFQAQKARVVNMSWMRPEGGFLNELELCAPSLSATERVAIARYSVDTLKRTMTAAMRAAPEILFVSAAGNSGEDTEFNDFALRIDLPNLLIIGAVDRAGDEVSFTNTGPLVKLFANGYLVETRAIGGGSETGSGTSLAAPGVVNAVAKMLAVNPSLTTSAIVEILFRTADTKGPRNLRLLHPAKAVAEARAAVPR